MPFAWPRWLRQTAHLARFLVVVLALAGQTAAGARAVPDAQALSLLRALDRATIFCQHDPSHQPLDAPSRHRGLADAWFMLTSARAAPPAILGAALFLASPSVGHEVRLAGLSLARAPPRRAAASALPRGPPDLI